MIVGALFSGFATTVEAAAIGAFYAFFTQVFVHRDLKIGRDMGRVAAECASTVGGVLLILGVAVGLTSWMIDADVPGRLLELTQQYISSRWMFLLALNGFLLVVGCLMDIFSATFVVAPLLVPLGLAYDVHPVHLGIIFIANLELGYLTPAGRPEPVPVVVPLPQAAARSGRGVVPDAAGARLRRAGHHLRAVADHRVAAVDGEIVMATSIDLVIG